MTRRVVRANCSKRHRENLDGHQLFLTSKSENPFSLSKCRQQRLSSCLRALPPHPPIKSHYDPSRRLQVKKKRRFLSFGEFFAAFFAIPAFLRANEN